MKPKKLFITFCIGIGLDMFTVKYHTHWFDPIILHGRR